MAYEIIQTKDGFKICKCFSKKGIPKERAIKQLKAIGMNENLTGGESILDGNGKPKIKMFELFKGTGSIGKVAKKLGFDVVSLDFDPIFTPTIETDILKWDYKKWAKDNNFYPSYIWASPSCNTYSPLAYPRKERDSQTAEPFSDRAKLGTKILYKTLEIIKYFQSENPNMLYTIENPRGMMRKDPKMKKLPNMETALYCVYGDIKPKPTNFWSNFEMGLDNTQKCPNKTVQTTSLPLNQRYSIPPKLVRTILTKAKDIIIKGKSILEGSGAEGDIFDQKRYDSLVSSATPRDKYEARRLKFPNLKLQPYDEYLSKLKEIARSRSTTNIFEIKKRDKELEDLKKRNEEYEQYIKENPEEQEVMCNYDEDGKPNKTRTTRGQCKLNNQKHFLEWEKENHPENAYFFRPALKAITKVGDLIVENVPMPDIVKDVYKGAREATRDSIEGRAKPADNKLYNKIKDEVYKKNPKHSLYRSALIQKIYQSEGGKYINDKMPKMNIKKWFKQDWISLNDYLRGDIVPCGNSNTEDKFNEYPLCRPLKIAEKLSKGDIKKMIKEKNELKEKPLLTKKVLDRDDLNIKPTKTGLGKDGNFKKQLQKLNITEDEYLDYAKKIANIRGYDGKKLELANDGKHKLEYDGVKFGAVDYMDFILYLHLVKEGKLPYEEAIEKMTNYRKRAYKVMKATNNKYSASSLAYNLLW